MTTLFTILLMIFCHIVDDYYLQGWLASAKQKQYWKENAPQKMYRFDYIWALIMHSFSWSFMIMLPVFWSKHFELSASLLVAFMLNVFVHATVDDLKANKRKINLWVDQMIHLFQIIITATVFL